jgi:hypothetical protein
VCISISWGCIFLKGLRLALNSFAMVLHGPGFLYGDEERASSYEIRCGRLDEGRT